VKGRVHPADEMTSRARLLAAYRGEAVDRLPYWAKVANRTWRTGQPEEVRGWNDSELLDYIRADGIFTRIPRPITVRRPHVGVEVAESGGERGILTSTPGGGLTETWTLDEFTRSWHPTEFPVKTREDLARYRWLYTDVELSVDEEKLQRAAAECERIGERGVVRTSWGTSPLMHLVEHVIGPAGTAYMLADHPGEMDELIGAMHAADLRLAGFLAGHTPADVVASVENTSTTLISPEQFERYCLPHLCDYGRAIEGAGKLHELHMCGHTKVLLEKIDAIPAASIEAFTAPSLGNTRLADGRAKAPSKTLIGGTNVNVWLLPVEDIKAYILTELDACPDHRRIVLTTAGVAPPGCPAEKFREIGEWIPGVPLRN